MHVRRVVKCLLVWTTWDAMNRHIPTKNNISVISATRAFIECHTCSATWNKFTNAERLSGSISVVPVERHFTIWLHSERTSKQLIVNPLLQPPSDHGKMNQVRITKINFSFQFSKIIFDGGICRMLILEEMAGHVWTRFLFGGCIYGNSRWKKWSGT